MVDGAGAVNDFVEPIAVNVAFAKAVTPLILICAQRFTVFSVTRGVRVEIPPLGQFAVSPIQSPERGA